MIFLKHGCLVNSVRIFCWKSAYALSAFAMTFAAFVVIVTIVTVRVDDRAAPGRTATVKNTAAQPLRMSKIGPEAVTALLVKAPAAFAVTVAADTFIICKWILGVTTDQPLNSVMITTHKINSIVWIRKTIYSIFIKDCNDSYLICCWKQQIRFNYSRSFMKLL